MTFSTTEERSGVAQEIREAFPELPSFGRLEFLGDGFSSYVVLLDDAVVFRIAKHSHVTKRYELENRLLPCLSDHLPVKIPRPLWFARETESFPFGLIGYRRISGTPFKLSLIPNVDLSRVAADLAQFLLALHECPLESAGSSGISHSEKLADLRVEVEPALRENLSTAQVGKVETWWESYLRNARTRAPALVHGDPWSENLLLSRSLNGVVGVVDFESLAIADIARDFAPQRYLGAGFQQELVEQYEKLGGDLGSRFFDRLRDESVLREVRGLQYALRYPESGEIVDAVSKIRALPILQ